MSTHGRRRIEGVVFDVNETLKDLSALRPIFEEFDLPPQSLEWWFAALLRDGMALAASDDYGSFAALVGVALDEVMAAFARVTPPDAASRLVSAFAELPLHADVGPAFERLAASGRRIVTFTNGSAVVTRALLERAGLDGLVDAVHSVEAERRWKPRIEAYQYVVRTLDVEAQALAMVAVHPWDLHGAARAGLVSAWVNRGNRPYPNVFRAPDLDASNLVDLADALVAWSA